MALGLIIVVALLGLRYAPTLGDVRDAREAANRFSAQIRATEPEDLDQATVISLQAGLLDLDQQLEPLRELMTNDPIIDVVRGLPAMGQQLEAADALLEATDSLIEATDAGLGIADQFVALRAANDADPSVELMPGLVALMAASSSEMDRISELLEVAESRLESIPPEALRQIREAGELIAEPLATYAPLLDTYRELDDVLPGMLGQGGVKRYLVLAQNPAELRPSGGYSGTVGVIALDGGRIVEQGFQDVYELDLQRDLPFIEPPEELADHLLGDGQSWRLADATWSPDYPTAAQKAREFYQLEAGDADIDGVITITTFALDRLLEVLGPVTVDGLTVEPGDVTLVLLGATRGEPGALEGRKDVLDQLATRVMDGLITLPADQWVPMLEALVDVGDQRMAQVWFDDADAQQLATDAGWAGAVAQDSGDYVYVVESNVAPTSKYNLVVDRSASLAVKLGANGDALSSLRLDWHNEAAREGEPYQSIREFSTNEEGWYGAYLRILVPVESELIAVNGRADGEIKGAGRIGEDTGRAVFGNYLLMPPGESTLTYFWASPATAQRTESGWEYRLVVPKQPDARPQPLAVRIDLPDGATVTEATDGAVVSDDRVTFETTLISDLEVRVAYTLATQGA